MGSLDSLVRNRSSRMRYLIDVLNRAIESYYMKDKEILSNHEYDKLFYELEQLEVKLGVHEKDSPVGTVGYKVVSELKNVRHAYPAKSLDKTKDIDVLRIWLGSQDGVLSYKMDGLTLVLTYQKGRLASAVTRGDGFIGEDVMHNVKYVSGIPVEIADKRELVIRGEVVISYQDFDLINTANKYANPRNLSSSSLRLLDPAKARGRCMQFFWF